MTDIYTRAGEAFISPEDMEACPPGTVILASGRQYTRQNDGSWEWGDSRYNSRQFHPRSCQVVSYPEGTVVVARPQETLAQYKWRFRNYALTSATNHSVSYEASKAVLDRLGTQLPVGRGVQVSDQRAWQDLPPGSMAFTGSPEVGSLTVWEKDAGGRWRTKVGDRSMDGTITIYRVGYEDTDTPEWVAAVSTDEQADAEQINEFNARVWRDGWALKRSQGWCSTYESILREFGITRACTRLVGHNGLRVGERVDPATAATLPLGSILRWQSSAEPDTFGLYVRASNVRNAAGTVKIGGTEGCPERNYHSSMEVMYVTAEGHPEWQINEQGRDLEALVAVLNPGIQFSQGEENSPQYTLARDGLIEPNVSGGVPETGRWTVADFGSTANFTIHNYPGVTL